MRLKVLTLLILTWNISYSQSPVFETIGHGNWNDAIWTCTANCAGAPAIPNLDAWPNPQVTIKHDITKSGGLSLASSGGTNISKVFIETSASLEITGLLDIKPGGTSFENEGNLIVNGNISVQSEFINSGTIDADDIEVKFDAGTDFISTAGTIQADNVLLGGKSTITGTTITTDVDFEITGSAVVAVNSLLVNVGGDFLFNGAANTVFGADMNVTGDVVHGASSALTLTGDVEVDGNFENSGTGSVIVGNTGSIDVTGDFLNLASGTITIDAGGILDITGDFLNSGNSLINVFGDLGVSQLINLIGSATIAGGGSGTLTWGTFNCEGGARINCGGIIYGPSTNCLPPDFVGNSLSLNTCSVVLPVSWLSLSATKNNIANEINWSTSSEKNNAYFIIESSTNGMNFEEIGRVNGNGTTDENSHYQYLDYQTTGAIVYYRILQVDYDGKSSYSSIVSIIDDNNSLIQIYPNPVVNNEIWVKSTDDEIVDIAIYNHLGQEISTLSAITMSSGYQKLTSLDDSHKGMFYLYITPLNGTQEVFKLIVE